MIPRDFEHPVSVATNSFLTNDLAEKHPARPAPDFLSRRRIYDLEIIGLARSEIERQQFVGGINDGEHKFCPT